MHPLPHDSQSLNSFLQKHPIDGILTRGASPSIIQWIRRKKIASMHMRGASSNTHTPTEVPFIDDDAVGKIAIAHFQQLNLKHCGYIHWSHLAWSEQRRQAFIKHSRRHQLSHQVITLNAQERNSFHGIHKLSAWVQKIPKPIGILACNDFAGMDFLYACQSASVAVPERVSIIGVDNNQLLCQANPITLSSIDLKASELGQQALIHISKTLQQTLPPNLKTHSPQPQLIQRASSSHIDPQLLILEKAYHWIETHAHRGPNVAELARNCGASKRQLERICHHQGKAPPAHLIRQKRIQLICQQLKTTSLTLEELAPQFNFADASGLANYIKRHTSQNPSHFRTYTVLKKY